MNTLTKDDALHNFTTVWEYVECGIAIVDAGTREIVAVNPVAARMFGDDASKMLGKVCHKCFCPAEASSCPILDKGQTVDRSERVFVRSDGKKVPIVKSVARIQYRGSPALLESFTDISPLKEAEEKLLRLHVAEEASRSKSAFLSRMSHEMRTPMNAIIGMSKIAEGTEDVAKLKYCLATISASASHLLGLINDVLDLSKIEAGKFELDCAPFDLEDVLRKLCNLVSEQMEEKGIAFRVRLDENLPKRLLGDELRLAQVITNLLSNALKFTPSGGSITLTATEQRRGCATSLLRFAVADTGIGMEAEHRDKLFTAFEQADASIPRKFGGTGLGLAISKNIAEKMNGTIGVVSSPGEGSTFTVEVELARAPGATALLREHGLSGLRLLVVDADETVRAAFAFLRGENLVDEAADGTTARTLAERAQKAGRPYDVIVSGCELPDMTAVDLAQSVGGALCRSRFVLTAGFRQWNRIDKEARAAGISRFISKPLFPSDITAALTGITENTGNSQTSARGNDDSPDFSRLTILLAEDVAINRDIFASLLERTNITIDEAENGREAVEKFNANPDRYDCIIMDVRMPEMDGLEATRTIRALDHDAAKRVPIIAMTADAFREDVESCLACGMNGHLAKPIDEKAVMAKIRELCGAG